MNVTLYRIPRIILLPLQYAFNILCSLYIAARIHHHVCSWRLTFFVSWYFCLHDVRSSGVSPGYSHLIVLLLCNKQKSSDGFKCIIRSKKLYYLIILITLLHWLMLITLININKLRNNHVFIFIDVIPL